MATKVTRILEGMKSFLQEALNSREKYLLSAKSFTRRRVLRFDKLCFFLVSQSKRSLSIELDEYFSCYGKLPCTKGALSKARYRVLWYLFKDWHRHLISLVYAAPKDLLLWKGFYLKGVDGTTLYLFKDNDIEKEFGGQAFKNGRTPMARVGLEVDLLNGYCTQAQIQPYLKSEKVFAEAFLQNSSEKDLLIYDRNFAGFEMIFKHFHQKTFFVMRCSVIFNQAVKMFVASGEKDIVTEFPILKNIGVLRKQGYDVNTQTTVRVRLLRIDIGQDEPEILITNLICPKKYPYSCFKEVYNYRWGDETKFDQIKNKLQIEIFSGHKPAAIYQDFFATIIAANLYNLILHQCDQELEKVNKAKRIPVAINQNVSIGLLKPRLMQLFISKKPNSILKELKNLFLNHVELVRPGRIYPRTKRVQGLNGKYQTFKNYRRAC